MAQRPAESLIASLPAPRLSLEFLRERLQNPPAYQPESHGDSVRVEHASPVAASVLVPLVMRDEITVMLTQRTTRLAKHSGQVAFPGGRRDPQDSDHHATALREAEEEIGLSPQHVTVLGTLSDYYTGTGYRITPVLALVQPPPALALQATEVDAAFEVPLAFLMNPENHQYRHYDWQGAKRSFYAMPYRASQWVEQQGVVSDPAGREFFIWGATAAMLRNLHRLLAAD